MNGILVMVYLKIRDCNCSDQCIDCVKTKLHRHSFPKHATPVLHPLDCIASDICGPMSTPTAGGFL
jgi:hypothetical protein